MLKKNWLILTVLSVGAVGCFHDEELRKEVFNVNTRVLALESELQDKQQVNSRQHMSSSSRVNQMEETLQKLRDEVDKLHVAIQKGEFPGSEGEPSIANEVSSLNEKVLEIEERIVELEKAQNEILGILEKLDKKKGEKTDKTEKKAKLSSLKEVEHAFQNKQYKEIIEQASQLLKGRKDSDSIRYYYSESLFKSGKLKEAALSFGELIKKDKMEHSAKIRLRMGDCFRGLGDKKTAVAYYKLLVEKYPHSSESDEAKRQIKKLEANHS